MIEFTYDELKNIGKYVMTTVRDDLSQLSRITWISSHDIISLSEYPKVGDKVKHAVDVHINEVSLLSGLTIADFIKVDAEPHRTEVNIEKIMAQVLSTFLVDKFTLYANKCTAHNIKPFIGTLKLPKLLTNDIIATSDIVSFRISQYKTENNGSGIVIHLLPVVNQPSYLDY